MFSEKQLIMEEMYGAQEAFSNILKKHIVNGKVQTTVSGELWGGEISKSSMAGPLGDLEQLPRALASSPLTQVTDFKTLRNSSHL